MEKPFVFNDPGLPTRYVPLGQEFRRYGTTLVCTERPKGLVPTAACKGCWFRRSKVGGAVVNCDDIQCSSFDRMDGRNVWFVEMEDL